MPYNIATVHRDIYDAEECSNTNSLSQLSADSINTLLLTDLE